MSQGIRFTSSALENLTLLNLRKLNSDCFILASFNFSDFNKFSQIGTLRRRQNNFLCNF